MSFLRDNGNFIKFSLGVDMKHLSNDERVSKYNRELKSDSRKRFFNGYHSTSNMQEKVRFYKDVLSVLAVYDFEYILLNIYFDNESDALLNSLRVDISDSYLHGRGTLNTKSLLNLFRGSLNAYKGSLTKGFLKNFFVETIELADRDWETENENNNPLISRLAEWIVEQLLVEKNRDQYIQETLLHFNKLWNLYYSSPYNYRKGHILIHKILDKYQKIDSTQFKVNLYEVIQNVKNIIDSLAPFQYHSPLLDIHQISFSSTLTPGGQNKATEAFLTRLTAFHKLVEEDSIFFTDLSKLQLYHVLEDFVKGTYNKRKALIKEIERRYEQGVTPSQSDMEKMIYIIDSLEKEDSEIEKFVASLKRLNYLFYIG